MDIISLYHSNDLQIFSPVLEGCLFSESTRFNNLVFLYHTYSLYTAF